MSARAFFASVSNASPESPTTSSCASAMPGEPSTACTHPPRSSSAAITAMTALRTVPTRRPVTVAPALSRAGDSGRASTGAAGDLPQGILADFVCGTALGTRRRRRRSARRRARRRTRRPTGRARTPTARRSGPREATADLRRARPNGRHRAGGRRAAGRVRPARRRGRGRRRGRAPLAASAQRAPAPAHRAAPRRPRCRERRSRPRSGQPVAGARAGAGAAGGKRVRRRRMRLRTPGAGKKERASRADLRLLRESSSLRARCLAAVLLPFIVYTIVLVVISRVDIVRVLGLDPGDPGRRPVRRPVGRRRESRAARVSHRPPADAGHCPAHQRFATLEPRYAGKARAGGGAYGMTSPSSSAP